MLSDLPHARPHHSGHEQNGRADHALRGQVAHPLLVPFGLRRLLANPIVVRNTLFLGANLLAGLCSYLLHSVVARLIGPAGYGIIASLIALSTVGLIPAHIIGTVVTSHVAHLGANGRMDRANDLVRRLTRLLLPVGAATTLLITVVAAPIATFLHVPATLDVALIAVTFVVAFVMPINSGAVLGLERYRWYAMSIALPPLLRLLMAALLAVVGFGLHGAVAGIALSALAAYALTFPPIVRLLRSGRAAFGPLVPLWRESVVTAIAITGITLLYTTDTLLAKHFLSDFHAGLYAAVTTTSKIILMLASGIICVLLPRFSMVVARSTNPIPAVVEGLLAIGALCTPVAIGCALIPALVLHILIGPAFAVAAPYLPLYAGSNLLLAFAQVFIYYFLAAGSRRFIPVIVVCCGLHAVLIWVRHGNEGDLVQATFLCTALLLVTMVALFIPHTRRSLDVSTPLLPKVIPSKEDAIP